MNPSPVPAAQPKIIRLRVDHRTKPPGEIAGFSLLWAFYVSGFNSQHHCQKCFRGERVAEFNTRSARSGVEIVLDQMDRYPFVYVCGVGSGSKKKRRETNLHFPLAYEAGTVATKISSKGYVFTAENAVEVDIDPLPPRWNGLPHEFWSCKNFQFGVKYFGYPSGS